MFGLVTATTLRTFSSLASCQSPYSVEPSGDHARHTAGRSSLTGFPEHKFTGSIALDPLLVRGVDPLPYSKSRILVYIKLA